MKIATTCGLICAGRVPHTSKRAEPAMSNPIRDHYFIVPDVDDANVLLMAEGKFWTLSHTTLTGAGDLTTLTIATPSMARVLEEWFARVSAVDKSLRVPWYGAGWMNAAGAWMVKHRARLDSKPTGPVEQVCSWQRSCVMRLPTTHGGAACFKAVPAVQGSERRQRLAGP